MSRLKQIHLDKYLLCAFLIFPSYGLATAPVSCTGGYEKLSAKAFASAAADLEVCIKELAKAKLPAPRYNLWAHFLAAQAYYGMNNFEKSRQHAMPVYEHIRTGTTELTKEQVSYIVHIVDDTKAKYRTTLTTVEVNYGLSAEDGCTSQGRNLEQEVALSGDAPELAYCRDLASRGELRISDFSVVSAATRKSCMATIEKYKHCKILRCDRGSYTLDQPILETGPKVLICDKRLIEYYSAPESERLAAIQDELWGPLGYELDDNKKASIAAPERNPFASSAR